MKRPFWLLFGVLVAGAVMASGYVLLTPKIGKASRAEIEAVLPASLKVTDPPDPAAEARYGKLVGLVKKIEDRDLSAALGSSAKPADPAARIRVLSQSKPLIDQVQVLLGEGAIRYPSRGISAPFSDSIKLKSFAKLLTLAVQDAAERGDQAECTRLSALSLRYGRALLEGGGVIIDSLVAIACDAISGRNVYEAEMANGFGSSGRERLLALLPVESGRLPELGQAIRRDFQQMFLPVLLNPKTFLTNEAMGYLDGNAKEAPAGTLDPVATAKLVGQIYEAGIADSQAFPIAPSNRGAKLAEAAGQGLPERPDEGGKAQEFWYRLRMNAGRNTLGRQLASEAIVFDGLSTAAIRRAANFNVLRAVLLLRSGKPAAVPDPYGKGNLHVDPKRRLVWSVGENGKDDGGAIAIKFFGKADDLGARY